MISLSKLQDALEDATVTVTFKTKAGHNRKMECTRDWSRVPQSVVKDADPPKLTGPDIICVYDFLVKDFRAFRKDSVVDFVVNEE